MQDVEIAEGADLLPIEEVAESLGVAGPGVLPYGGDKAKLRLPAPSDEACRGKLVLVTAMTATRKGGGKTVTTVGLGQAFGRLGRSHCICLRQPSLGPTLGMKGGAAGGGYSQVVPMADINLHFTGDMHAVSSAHNLLAAMVDNHVHFGAQPEVEPSQIVWPRVVDLCDRQLRHCEIGLGRSQDGFAHRTRFDITASSEVMAVLALARDHGDLRERLQRMIVGYDGRGQPVRAHQMRAVGAMEVLLQQAMLPNLVQTLERTPALLHCGPFANLAHGCSSVAATRLALSLCDYVITEAGFGSDLGAEKFFHIKCRSAGLSPSAAVLVVSCPALRYHGGAPDGALYDSDPEALRRGLCNARVHIENLVAFGIPVVVAHNAFHGDSPAEVALIRGLCDELAVDFAVSEAFAGGGAGALALADRVLAAADSGRAALRFVYEPEQPLLGKLERLARQVYRADGIDLDAQAHRDLERLQRHGFSELPLCVAKTPHSLSDRASLRGVPRGWKLRVRRLWAAAGPGFVVVETGNLMRMPGMPREPGAMHIHVDDDGRVRGL